MAVCDKNQVMKWSNKEMNVVPDSIFIVTSNVFFAVNGNAIHRTQEVNGSCYFRYKRSGNQAIPWKRWERPQLLALLLLSYSVTFL